MYSIHQIYEAQSLNPNYDATSLFLPSFVPIGTHYRDYPWRRERIQNIYTDRRGKRQNKREVLEEASELLEAYTEQIVFNLLFRFI